MLLQQRRREEFEKKKADEELKAKEDQDRHQRQNQVRFLPSMILYPDHLDDSLFRHYR